MALRRKEKRTERSKLDATPPWDTNRHHESAPTSGPFDITDAELDSGIERLDLGSLLIPTDIGLEVRIDVDDQGQVAAVNLVNDAGQMQLGAFAAPRNEGIWESVRAEIKDSIAEQGGLVEDNDGPFGPELSGALPAPGGFTPVRFVGVDGPRWFLRGMLVGSPATDEASAEVFLNAFRAVVVVRGNEPLPVRDPIPLVLPKQAAEQIAAATAEQQAAEQHAGTAEPEA